MSKFRAQRKFAQGYHINMTQQQTPQSSIAPKRNGYLPPTGEHLAHNTSTTAPRMSKFRAQRKFAQGYHINMTQQQTPQSSIAPKRNGYLPPTGEHLAHNTSTTAPRLLDKVSLHALHKHLQPIVLVERMVTNESTSNLPYSPLEDLSSDVCPPLVFDTSSHEDNPYCADIYMSEDDEPLTYFVQGNEVNKQDKNEAPEKELDIFQVPVWKPKPVTVSKGRAPSPCPSLSVFSIDDLMSCKEYSRCRRLHCTGCHRVYDIVLSASKKIAPPTVRESPYKRQLRELVNKLLPLLEVDGVDRTTPTKELTKKASTTPSRRSKRLLVQIDKGASKGKKTALKISLRKPCRSTSTHTENNKKRRKIAKNSVRAKLRQERHPTTSSRDESEPSTSRSNARVSATVQRRTSRVSKPTPPKAPSPEPATSVKSEDEAISLSNQAPRPDQKSTKTELLEAPVFYPTEEEFDEPMSYLQSIMPEVAKFGVAKVVPPKGFSPPCVLQDDVKFNVQNQYTGRLFNRWGTATKEMAAIKYHLASQGVKFTRAPLINGLEANLPKLFNLVQRHGGLKNVIERNKWSRIAQEMNLKMSSKNKLDALYVKYILPYDTLAIHEREFLKLEMERLWVKKNRKMLGRAVNPLHRVKKLLEESESSGEENDEDIDEALDEAEDCVIAGKTVDLKSFKKIAANAVRMYFPDGLPSTQDVEKQFWSIVTSGTDHVCVYSASVDTQGNGYGFTTDKADPYARHPWNLKQLSQDRKNFLRHLGKVVGATVPTLHLGMTFATSALHRDPHGLPWLEYMHSGPGKIWYGISDSNNENFRHAMEDAMPTFCQNKSLWLSSDMAMCPPEVLQSYDVSMCRVVQNPGEFIVVASKAYSCSISTGYTVSESVYFAPYSYIDTIMPIFKELRDNCEPAMFSLEQLLLSAARAWCTPPSIIKQINRCLAEVLTRELHARARLAHLPTVEQSKKNKKKNEVCSRDKECYVCQVSLYLSGVTGLTDGPVCLEHALALLKTTKGNKRPLSELCLTLYIPTSELESSLALANKM